MNNLYDKKSEQWARDPLTNSGLNAPKEFRQEKNIVGYLPPSVLTLDQQCERFMQFLRKKPSDIQKYQDLMYLQDTNETLFFAVLARHPSELTPIVYTPTVGQACVEYSDIFRRPRGLFISIEDKGNVKDILETWQYKDRTRVIVMTDGERILGLGDQGANGMGIPVGKLVLYTSCAGIHPDQVLPVTIDVGTNNEDLLNNEFYIGLKRERLRGAEYDEFIDEVVMSMHEVFNKPLIQFEDFGNSNAFRLLEHYQDKVCTFNDDIQGTASVALAGVFSSLRILSQNIEEQTFLFLGAGEAGVGIGNLIVTALIEAGLEEAEARKKCWFVDSRGLVVASRKNLAHHKLAYAHEYPKQISDLANIVEEIKPSVLIGVSGQPNTFTKEVIELMASINEKPVIFALSNPTSKAECTAEMAYKWSGGNAIFASGSPFDPVTYLGKKHVPGQGNNSYIFPGVGLGVIVSEATNVDDGMFFVAARRLSELVADSQLDIGCLYPPLEEIREVSIQVSLAVIDYAVKNGLTTAATPSDGWEDAVRSYAYEPEYNYYLTHPKL
eukprot:TRINITY_DN2591_c0_g1_i1.p1 TRINITY_DN2591_c0_g1~~TRINITY_DN2591_c0_g1_i1.p1  ORF type:complete len:553 (-),score=138.33 TRINITY_DN2591_c0_g1_i1:225-1883(-)